jgi:hypothetical protein
VIQGKLGLYACAHVLVYLSNIGEPGEMKTTGGLQLEPRVSGRLIGQQLTRVEKILLDFSAVRRARLETKDSQNI